jgi:hypothetical protein
VKRYLPCVIVIKQQQRDIEQRDIASTMLPSCLSKYLRTTSKNDFLRSYAVGLFHQIPHVTSHNARSRAVTLIIFTWHKAARGEFLCRCGRAYLGIPITELSLSVARRVRIPQRRVKAKLIARLRAKKFETASLSV